LRYLSHNIYENVSAFTGCCSGAIPELVDPVSVMATWMGDIVGNAALHGGAYAQDEQRLVNVGVTQTCDAGVTWNLFLPENTNPNVAGLYFEADGTTLTAVATAFQAEVEAAQGVVFAAVAAMDTYVSAFTPAAPNCTGGIVMQAAFTETQFGDCTFQCSDNYEIEPLSIQASMIDETGDPCVFDQLCISDGITPSGSDSSTVYPAIQAASTVQGTGESVLRDLILSESYNTNRFATDLRIREITQGNDITAAVNRNSLYTCYYIKHSIPRMSNATSQLDNDQYVLKIPMTGVDANFEAFMAAWLTAANSIVTMQTY